MEPDYELEYQRGWSKQEKFAQWLESCEDELRQVYSQDYDLGIDAIDQEAFDKWAWERWQNLC